MSDPSEYSMTMRTVQLMMRTKAVFRLTGVSFCADRVARLSVGDLVRLTPQPDNPHDPHAIRATTLDGEALGWVPAPIAARLASDGTVPALLGKVTALRTHDGITVGADIALDQVVPAPELAAAAS